MTNDLGAPAKQKREADSDSVALPSPTSAERSVAGFDAGRWALANGVCSYHGGAHQLEKSPIFGGSLYCRLCRERESDLLRRSKTGAIYVESEE